MRRFWLLLIPVAVLVGQQSRKIPNEARAGYEAITAGSLSARLHFLASPELEGRETGMRGAKIAARYIASEFQGLGLKPIGDSGSYFQNVNLEITKISNDAAITVKGPSGTSRFPFRKEFLSFSGLDEIVTAQVLFIGFMDSRVDTAVSKGKIILALPGRKDDARDTTVPAMRRIGFVRQFAGSLATLVVADEKGDLSVERLEARFSSQLERGAMRVAGGDARSGRGRLSFPIVISPKVANAVINGSGLSLAQLKELALREEPLQPITVAQNSVSIDMQSSKEERVTENVVGLLEGSDPKLKEEVVVFSAHYDHVGIGANDRVYPGADDDGSGTVAVIELAQAFAANPVRPKRSLVFLAVMGEEKGLWGSDWYVKHPAIPLEKTIADLNTDMIGRMDKKYEALNNPDYVYVIGSDKISTQLDSLLQLSNKESENLLLDYTYNDDKDPQQFYRRSDHYNFARNGVPIVFFFTGVHDDYHQPTDTVDKILFERMTKIVRLMYTTGWRVANHKGGLAKNGNASMFTR